MKRLLTGIVTIAAMGMHMQAALAQPADVPAPAAVAQQPASPAAAPVENEFTAFRKMQARAAKTPDASSTGSPLGPAADLPLRSPPPLTANALNMNAAGAMNTMNTAGAIPQTPEEMQAAMDAEAAEQKKKMEEETFNAALKGLLPLTPGQIRTTLGSFKESREAAETPIAVPKPEQEVQTVSLDPGDPPLVVKMSPSFVTTVTILDQTGAPWPIQDVSWAGPFTVTTPEEGGHVIRITPSTAHGMGNISIRLVDMITPMTMQLTTGLESVHYRLDVRIAKPGPLAKIPLIEYGGLKTVAGKDDQLVSVLDGTPPDGAEKMKIEGVDGRTAAWRLSGRIYLRTPLTLLSPGWDSSVSSADGMNVYTLADASVVLLSDAGRMVRVHIGADEVTP